MGTHLGLSLLNLWLWTSYGCLRYMTFVEGLPNYGVHYFSIKDKQGTPWRLGVGPDGLNVYDIRDSSLPREVSL